jgi:phage-related protein
VYPEVRVYADPYEGLSAQLTQLRGLIKLVPPLIEADREKRWEEISSRPSDGEDGDVIDVYSQEAGPEEDWGFANFDRTIYLAAVVTAWAAFQDYLVRQLRKSRLPYDLTEHPVLAKLVQEDVRNRDRRFDALVRRYSDFAGVALKELPTWAVVASAACSLRVWVDSRHDGCQTMRGSPASLRWSRVATGRARRQPREPQGPGSVRTPRARATSPPSRADCAGRARETMSGVARRWRHYETPSGRRPVKAFIDGLSDTDKASVLAAMKEVRDHGLRAARHLLGDIYEVRADGDRVIYRVLFAAEGERGRILLALDAINKKTRRTPPATIDTARRRLADWRRRSAKPT